MSIRAILTRALQALTVIIVVIVLTVLLIHLVPGNPAEAILGTHATPQNIAALSREMHLNRSLIDQIGLAIRGLFTGNLGTSLLFQGQSVTSIIMPAFLVTLSLIGLTVVMSVLLGVPLGLFAADTKHRSLAEAIRLAATILLVMPSFFLGLVLLLCIALVLGLAPAGGWPGAWPANLEYLWLPAIGLSGYLMPLVFRATRHAATEILAEDFVEAAVVRGLSSRAITYRHVLPNCLLPLVTLVGYNVSGLIGGAVVIEVVFNLPGIGSVLVSAVEAKDYPIIQATAMLFAIFVVVVNFLTDVLYGVIDPRIRTRG